jgi:hypothetical protein
MLGVFIFAFLAIFFVAFISCIASNLRTAPDGITSAAVSYLANGTIEVPAFSLSLIGNQSRVNVETNKMSIKFANKKITPVTDFLNALPSTTLQSYQDSQYTASRSEVLDMLLTHSQISTEAVQKLSGPVIYAVISKFINQTCFARKLQKKLNEVKAALSTCESYYNKEKCGSSDIKYEISEIESIIDEATKNTKEIAEKILTRFDDEHFETFYNTYLKTEVEFFAENIPMLFHNSSKISHTAKKIATISAVRKPAAFIFNTIAYNGVYILLYYAIGVIFALIGYTIIIIILKKYEIVDVTVAINNGDESIPPVSYDDQYEEAITAKYDSAFQPSPDPYNIEIPIMQQPQIDVVYPIN